MKNLFGKFESEPESVLWLTLLSFLILALVSPLLQYFSFLKKKARFDQALSEIELSPPAPDNTIIPCHFCSSQRSEVETVSEIPTRVQFRLFMIKRTGNDQLCRVRCVKCGSKLFHFRLTR